MEIIIGVGASLLTQGIKKYAGTSEYGTLLAVFAFSLVGAGVYAYLQASGVWDSLLPVLTSAGSFYTFVIARFPKAD